MLISFAVTSASLFSHMQKSGFLTTWLILKLMDNFLSVLHRNLCCGCSLKLLHLEIYVVGEAILITTYNESFMDK